MVSRRRLVRYYLITVLAAVVVFTAAYDVGMAMFENEQRTLLESFEVVMQTITTTGYGQDAALWGTEMTLLVVGMEVSSLVLISAAFPIVLVPLVEEALSTTPPTALEEPMANHVVVCTYSTRTETLAEELGAAGVAYVVVEPDRETATDLYETGEPVVHADPETVDALRAVDAADARAVVADADDEVDLSIIMAAGEVAPDVPVYSIAEDDELAVYHDHAGADRVFSPRELLGQGLASKVRGAVADDAVDIGKDVRIGEFPVRPGSELQRATVGEASIQDRTGARLIGAWRRGEFRTPPFPDLRLDEHTVLVVVGGEADLERVGRLADSEFRDYGRGDVVIAGFGVVGSTVGDVLTSAEVTRTVLDARDHPGVDVVGDATDPSVLREAGVPDAKTVVLALDDDTTTLLATFVVRDIAPDVELVVRADDTENVRKLYRAGADYVLALATVTGRLLASTIAEEEEMVSVDRRVGVIRSSAEPFAGQTVGEAAIQERTGCTVVAIEHLDGRVDTDIEDWKEFRPTDELVLAGMQPDIERFHELAAEVE